MSGESPKRVLYTIALPLGIAMLVFWGVMTFAFSGPGWVHLFLTVGVFLVIWRIAAGGTERAWEDYLKSERAAHAGPEKTRAPKR